MNSRIPMERPCLSVLGCTVLSHLNSLFNYSVKSSLKSVMLLARVYIGGDRQYIPRVHRTAQIPFGTFINMNKGFKHLRIQIPINGARPMHAAKVN